MPLASKEAGGPRVDMESNGRTAHRLLQLLYYLMRPAPADLDTLGKEPTMTDTTTPTRVADLRPGDVVRLTGGHWTGHTAEGEEKTISHLDDGRAVFTDTVSAHHVDDDRWPFEFVSRPEVVEPTLEEALAEGRYHSDLFPIFEKWSAEADEAGYCAEYDRLVRRIGAPTRAEVRRIVRERDGGNYMVRIPVTVMIPVEVTARNEEDARSQAAYAPLGGSERNSGTWPGLTAGIRQVLEEVETRSYARSDEMRYEGSSSFEVSER